MKIDFVEDEYIEDDHSWTALFVKIDDGKWHMAKPNYGTEDKNIITEMLSGNFGVKENIIKTYGN